MSDQDRDLHPASDCECGHDHSDGYSPYTSGVAGHSSGGDSHDSDSCNCGHEHSHGEDSCGCGHSHGETNYDWKKELYFIIPPLVMMVAGIVFESWLSITPLGLGLYLVFVSAYLLAGWKVLLTAFRNLIHRQFFDEFFLMTIATLAALVIGQLPEAVGVMLFFRIGEMVQDIAVSRSRRTISSLVNIRPLTANLITPEGTVCVAPEEVKVKDLILVKVGEKVPLDGEIMEGVSSLDTSALTGESLPRDVFPGDTVMAGTINRVALLKIRVNRLYQESSVARILEMVESATARKAPTERLITSLAKIYTPSVVGLSVLVAILPPLLLPGATFSDWIYRACVILVISCPCALVISIPLGYFGGIAGASRKGILVKGATFLDALTKVRTVVFDKTGTLTKAIFKVSRVVPDNGFSQDELLQLVSATETHSNHPIAQSIRGAAPGNFDFNISDFEEMPGYGVSARINGKSVVSGSDKLLHRDNIPHSVCDVGGTGVHAVVEGRYAGYICITDEIRDDARVAISRLKGLGIHSTVMLTGDKQDVAARVAHDLGIDSFRSELLPEDKVRVIEELESHLAHGEKIAFVGDGINDAPVIARAHVGIAMGGLGSDAAIESADVVMMTDNLNNLAEAILISRKTRNIVWQNIVFALTVKALFIFLGAMGVADLWEAVFADVGVALIAILNATRAMR